MYQRNFTTEDKIIEAVVDSCFRSEIAVGRGHAVLEALKIIEPQVLVSDLAFDLKPYLTQERGKGGLYEVKSLGDLVAFIEERCETLNQCGESLGDLRVRENSQPGLNKEIKSLLEKAPSIESLNLFLSLDKAMGYVDSLPVENERQAFDLSYRLGDVSQELFWSAIRFDIERALQSPLVDVLIDGQVVTADDLHINEDFAWCCLGADEEPVRLFEKHFVSLKDLGFTRVLLWEKFGECRTLEVCLAGADSFDFVQAVDESEQSVRDPDLVQDLSEPLIEVLPVWDDPSFSVSWFLERNPGYQANALARLAWQFFTGRHQFYLNGQPVTQFFLFDTHTLFGVDIEGRHETEPLLLNFNELKDVVFVERLGDNSYAVNLTL